MIILGIDPGLATMGYGVVEHLKGNSAVVDYGVVTTPKDLTLPQRLNRIEEGVTALIEKFRPEVAEARGVILLTANKLVGEEVYEYTPNQIKQAITGYGGADKIQMQLMVQALLRLKKVPRPDDAADALAVALCHAHTSRLSTEFKVK